METEPGWVVDPGLTSSPCWSWALTSREALGGTGPRGWCPAWVELGSLGPCPHPGAVSPSVCRTAETRPPPSPFLCLDLTYISLLLQELGFPGDKVLKLTRKIDNVETSWALGATFHYIDSLSRHKNPAS